MIILSLNLYPDKYFAMAGNEMDRILFILHEIKDNNRILKRLLDFMEAGIVPGTEQ